MRDSIPICCSAPMRSASSRCPTAATRRTSTGSSRPSAAILPLDGFHLSRSLSKALKSDRFAVTRDRAFAEVVRACADARRHLDQRRDRGELCAAACRRPRPFDRSLGGRSAGRRPLRRPPRRAPSSARACSRGARDASKVALAWLVARLKVGGFRLLDCQFMTEHLRSLGAIEIAQADYLRAVGLGARRAGRRAQAAARGRGRIRGARPAARRRPCRAARARRLRDGSSRSSWARRRRSGARRR